MLMSSAAEKLGLAGEGRLHRAGLRARERGCRARDARGRSDRDRPWLAVHLGDVAEFSQFKVSPFQFGVNQKPQLGGDGQKLFPELNGVLGPPFGLVAVGDVKIGDIQLFVEVQGLLVLQPRLVEFFFIREVPPGQEMKLG